MFDRLNSTTSGLQTLLLPWRTYLEVEDEEDGTKETERRVSRHEGKSGFFQLLKFSSLLDDDISLQTSARWWSSLEVRLSQISKSSLPSPTNREYIPSSSLHWILSTFQGLQRYKKCGLEINFDCLSSVKASALKQFLIKRRDEWKHGLGLIKDLDQGK